jgi:hypothetical protein
VNARKRRNSSVRQPAFNPGILAAKNHLRRRSVSWGAVAAKSLQQIQVVILGFVC